MSDQWILAINTVTRIQQGQVIANCLTFALHLLLCPMYVWSYVLTDLECSGLWGLLHICQEGFFMWLNASLKFDRESF